MSQILDLGLSLISCQPNGEIKFISSNTTNICDKVPYILISSVGMYVYVWMYIAILLYLGDNKC